MFDSLPVTCSGFLLTSSSLINSCQLRDDLVPRQSFIWGHSASTGGSIPSLATSIFWFGG